MFELRSFAVIEHAVERSEISACRREPGCDVFIFKCDHHAIVTRSVCTQRKPHLLRQMRQWCLILRICGPIGNSVLCEGASVWFLYQSASVAEGHAAIRSQQNDLS